VKSISLLSSTVTASCLALVLADTSVLLLTSVSKSVISEAVWVCQASDTFVHSTAITQGLTLVIVVSVACHTFIPANCGLSSVSNHIISLTSQSASASISHVHAVLLPSILLVAMCCILANVTASSSIVQVAPLLETVMSHLSQSETILSSTYLLVAG